MSQPSITGQRIDRYIVEGELGSGGFGAVYRARHSVLGSVVALKVLAAQHATEPSMVERFLREAQLSAGIGNPHIVGVHDAGITKDGQPFLALELLEGEDLENRIRRVGPLRIQDALDVAAQMLIGLGAAHAAGIVHRDMKPANVFLTHSTDGRPFVKLLDFGISKVVDPSRVSPLTQTGMMLGTPAYMAPEQIANTSGVDHRADLYAAAVILFESISGRLPYAAENLGDLLSRVQGNLSARLDQFAQVPTDLADILAKGLSHEPAMRFQSADEMRAAIDTHRVNKSLPTAPRPQTPAPITQSSLIGNAVTPPLGQIPARPQYGLAAPVPSAAPSYASAPNTYGAPPSGYGASPYAPSVPGHAPSSGYGANPYAPSQQGSIPGYASSSVGSAPGYPSAANSFGAPSTFGGPVPSTGSSSPLLWIGLVAVLVLVPLACVVGGGLAFGFSDDAPSDPIMVPDRPLISNPPATPPGNPITPIAPIVPPSFPPATPPRPPPRDWNLPPVAEVIPVGADPCTVPVVHGVQCDRQYEEFLPPTCEVRNGRELHILGAYTPSTDGRMIVDIARTAAPIVLVLSAYAETHFVIRLAEGAQLEAVHTVGYNNHTVEGVPPGVRVEDHGRRGFPIMGWEWGGEGEDWSGYATAQSAERETGLPLRGYAGCYQVDHWVLGQRAP